MDEAFESSERESMHALPSLAKVGSSNSEFPRLHQKFGGRCFEFGSVWIAATRELGGALLKFIEGCCGIRAIFEFPLIGIKEGEGKGLFVDRCDTLRG